MNDLMDLIIPECVIARMQVAKATHVLSELAKLLADKNGLRPGDVYELIMERERLGPTGIGDGVAIPHASIPGLSRPVAGFAKLETPVDFASIDGRPADLVFMLLTPAGESGSHLRALARASRFFNASSARERLRQASGLKQVLAAFASSVQSNAA
jgi:nitrogen PTS system EIIA component